MEPTWLQPRREPPKKRWKEKAQPPPPPPSLEGELPEHQVGKIFTCGCGHLGAELLCQLLRRWVKSVLDVRELDHSTKRPWFNSDVLEGTMKQAGLEYKYIGQDDDVPSWAAAVVAAAQEMPWPVCLLGVRALVRECPRLGLAQQLQELWPVEHLQPSPEAPPRLLSFPHQDVFAKEARLLSHVQQAVAAREAELGLEGSWQQRIRSRYKNVVPWEEWDKTRVFPEAGDEPLVIALPFDTSLLVIPGFLNRSAVYALQQATLPGAVDYEQPRRQVRNPDGTFTQFNERHKEAWLCNDYNYRDTRRVAPPRVHPGQKLSPKIQELLRSASAASAAPFNGAMCRWEPPGVHLKDGPHTYATHCGWSKDSVIGLMAVGATRLYHIHGIPWYHGRGRREVVVVNIPLKEGMLVALGGPLREKWLYAQPRDEEMLPERVQFTLQMHADVEVAKGADQSCSLHWTEDGDAPLKEVEAGSVSRWVTEVFQGTARALAARDAEGRAKKR
ncbi:unnamed protein product [Effrenium voratum]|uniref:Uncharacterized protein n=1 Tax=Effrenium voratum TaxID=2562239 RepID=A0AA36JQ59_9DINO|nr:unnamed protein product [Effrenium voratum]